MLLAFFVEGASFNCDSAKLNAFESTICSSPELNQLDEKLALKYKQALSAYNESKKIHLPDHLNKKQMQKIIKETQLMWIKVSRRIPITYDRSIVRSYQRRIAELELFYQASLNRPFTIECESELQNCQSLDKMNKLIANVYQKKDSRWPQVDARMRFYLPFIIEELNCTIGHRLNQCISIMNNLLNESDILIARVELEYFKDYSQECYGFLFYEYAHCSGSQIAGWQEIINVLTEKIKQVLQVRDHCEHLEDYYAAHPYGYKMARISKVSHLNDFDAGYRQYAKGLCYIESMMEEGTHKTSGFECEFELAEKHYRNLLTFYGRSFMLDDIIEHCSLAE